MTRAPSGADRIEAWLGPAGEAYHIIKPMVEFLCHPLDSVTGDPDQLRAKAQAWRDAGKRLGELADQEQSARMDLLSYWEGEAAQSFGQEMTQVNQSMRDAQAHFDSTAELLDVSAQGAQECQDLVEQIVRELIAWLIVTIVIAIASSWITLGASLAAGTAAGWIEAGVAGTRAAQVGLRLANFLRKVAAFLKRMSDFAKAYKLTKIRSVGVQKWAAARYASADGYKLIATNWVAKQTIVKPVADLTTNKWLGADKTVDLPTLL